LYDEHDLTEDVKAFLRYNANKALQNLGFDALFPEERVNPIVLSSMGETAETHDFFSATGNYAMVEEKPTTDEDWTNDWDEDEEW
jgi:ribonucleoside-diphosphate reductase beta chain